MKKILLIVLLFGSATWVWAGSSEVKSLRGDVALDAPSVPIQSKAWLDGEGKINRNYNQQPPMVPHDISDFEICHVPQKDAPALIGDAFRALTAE